MTNEELDALCTSDPANYAAHFVPLHGLTCAGPVVGCRCGRGDVYIGDIMCRLCWAVVPDANKNRLKRAFYASNKPAVVDSGWACKEAAGHGERPKEKQRRDDDPPFGEFGL